MVRYVYVTLVPSHYASHTRKAFSRERIARVCNRCCSALFSSLCWTGRARACGARAGTGRFIAYARGFRNAHSPIYNTPHNQKTLTEHTRQTKHRILVPMSNRVVLHEARRHSCSFQSAARPTRCHVVPRFCPRYQAAPTRAAQGLTSGTRRAHEFWMLHTRSDTNALFTMCAHPVGYIDEAPLHYPRTIPSTRVT